MTGLHALHMVIGIVLLAILARISDGARRPSRARPREKPPIAAATTEVIERV